MRFIPFCIILFVACKAPDAKLTTGQFLNMDSLVKAQAGVLIGYGVKKAIHVNDSVFPIKETRKPIDWNKTLEAFQELSQFNRLIYRDAFSTITKKDSKSNLIIRSWEAKTTLPLRSFKLFFLPATQQVKRIEISMQTSDFYYESERKLVMEFSLLGGENRLESYCIAGSQKYFWAQPEHFSINCEVIP